jgi:hypothetical protein
MLLGGRGIDDQLRLVKRLLPTFKKYVKTHFYISGESSENNTAALRVGNKPN